MLLAESLYINIQLPPELAYSRRCAFAPVIASGAQPDCMRGMPRRESPAVTKESSS
jgi:hypothetical protein